MDLVLWRHAEAQEWVDGCHDASRALTPKGEKQAAKMASWLDRHLPDGAKVWPPEPTCRDLAGLEILMGFWLQAPFSQPIQA